MNLLIIFGGKNLDQISFASHQILHILARYTFHRMPLLDKNAFETKRLRPGSVDRPANTCLARAMSTTIKTLARLYPMTNDFAAAMRTLRRHCLDRTFKAIKHVRLACRDDFKCFVIFIAACFTACHGKCPPVWKLISRFFRNRTDETLLLPFIAFYI